MLSNVGCKRRQTMGDKVILAFPKALLREKFQLCREMSDAA